MRRPSVRAVLAPALACAVLLAGGRARAAEDDLPVGDEPPRIVPIVVADAYWAWHDPPPSGRTATLLTTASRHNELTVNLAAIGARLQHAKLTGAVVIQAGTSVDALVGTQIGREVWKHVQLANVGWKTGDLHLEAGVLPSLFGREGFVSTTNWNYTRAFFSDVTPYFMAGARATYKLSPSWTVAGTVFNGFDTFRNDDDRPSGHLYLAYEPSETFSIRNAALVVPGRQGSLDRNFVRLIDDLIVTLRPHTRVELAAEGSIGTDQNARVEDPTRSTAADQHFVKNPAYGGALLTARWKFAKTTYLAARGELMIDRNGALTGRGARELTDRFGAATPPGQRFLGGTLTLGWQPHPSFLARVEALHRVSDQPWFAGGDSFDPKKRSTSFVVSAAFAY